MFRRALWCSVLFTAGAWVCSTLPVGQAQQPTPKDKAKDAKTADEIRQLKAEVAELKQKNAALTAELKKERNDGDDKLIKQLKAQLEADQKTLSVLKSQAATDQKLRQELTQKLSRLDSAASFAVVTFTAKDNPTTMAISAFLVNARSTLGALQDVRGIWTGLAESADTTAAKQVIVVLLFDGPSQFDRFSSGESFKNFKLKYEKNWPNPEVRAFHKR
jgi:hypothetical protein